MTREETARQAALDRVGDADVYGAWDQPCTPAERRKYARLSPEYAEAIEDQCQVMRGTRSSCSGCKYEGRRIHDCRGLTSACAGAAGVQIRGQTVARQWNEAVWDRKGEIGTLPRDAQYAQLFRHNGAKWAHTGCYIGNGETVDARGHASGVIRKQLSQYKWTHWAIPVGMDESAPKTEPSGGEGVIYSAIVTTKSGSLNIRSGPGTQYPKTGSLPKGEKVDILMEYDLDGDGTPEWAYMGGDGKQGYVSMAYLTRVDEGSAAPATSDAAAPSAPKAEADPAALRWAVYVPCASREEAEAIQAWHPGSILTAYKPPDEKGE